jgi:hypothetical protein
MTVKPLRFRDPLSFAPISRQSLPKGDEGVWVEPPGLSTTRLRIPPSFHDCPSGQSIFGPLDSRPPVNYPPAFALARRDVRLVGYRTVLGEDGFFCADEAFVDPVFFESAIRRLALTDEFNNEATGLVKNGPGDEFLFEARERPVIEQRGAAALLCSTEPSNYGSFLFRILPKLRTLAQTGLKDIPVIVPAYTRSMADLLTLSGIVEERIVKHYANAIYKIDRAIIVSLRNSQAYLDDESLAHFKFLREKYGVPAQGRRLYLTRRTLGTASSAATSRVMRNEDELINALRSHDFEIVEPSRLSALEQIKLFSSASLIIGPSGSAMFNAVFCHPGTKLVDIESEPHWIHAHMCLFGSLGLDYGIFEGETDDRDYSVAHKPFTVNIEALMRRVLDFEREPEKHFD